MSSSSSDSDSDDIEPIRRIKINIKPRDNVAKKDGADVEAIKASVEAWRPLGPRPHPSLTRRQSSLSSMSSLSFGTNSIQGGLNSAIGTPNQSSTPTASHNHHAANYHHQYIQYNNSPPTVPGGALGLSATTASVGGTGTNDRGNNSTKMAASSAGVATTTATSANNFMRSSPSCSSLVNEFSNRASFSNFMSNSASRTSSPLTFMGGSSSSETSVPIALAIQESIELTVRGQKGQPAGGEMKTRFETRALGNIKVAFPNSFARLCSNSITTGSCSSSTSSDNNSKPIPALKLRLHSTENIIRYYASGLVKDLDDSKSSSLTGSVQDTSNSNNNNNNNNNYNHENNSNNTSASLGNSRSTSTNGSEQQADETSNNYDIFDMNESPTRRRGNTKIIEFDMDALISQLKQLYDQAPNLRYYNVDVLRYQIMPLDEFEKCPLQVCAYWKIEPKLIKCRVDFKHSNQSGLTLERLREISFGADLSNLVPPNLSIQPVAPNQVSTLAQQQQRPPPPQLQPRIASACPPNFVDTSSSISSSNNNNRDSFRNLSSGTKSESSLFGDCNGQNMFTSNTAPTTLMNQKHHHQQANGSFPTPQPVTQQQPTPQPAPRQINNLKNTFNQTTKNALSQQIRLPPPPSSGHSRNHFHQMHSRGSNLTTTTTAIGAGNQMTGMETLRKQPSPFLRNQSDSSSGRSSESKSITSVKSGVSILDQLMSLDHQALPNANMVPQQHYISPTPSISSCNSATSSAPAPPPVAAAASSVVIPTVPYITFEPHANWNDDTKQLVWRFDNLLSFYKSDGYGSLLAKLDFRANNTPLHPHHMATESFAQSEQDLMQETPCPIDVKFMVVDSTLSKVSLTIDSTGYRMSLLKKEVRSGRYKSEPYLF